MGSEGFADPLPPSMEGDYVACFQALTQVEVAIRKEGPHASLVLRRSMLALEMGDLARALESAKDAVAAAPRNADAHFHEGMVWLAVARFRAGVAVLGPGKKPPKDQPLRSCLESAYESLCAAARCRPGDPDARAALDAVEAILEHEDDALPEALHRF